MKVTARRVADFEHTEKPGDFFITPSPEEGDGVRRLTFRCPCGCNTVGGIRILHAPYDDDTKKKRCWGWDGNEEQPTTEPSIAIMDRRQDDGSVPVHWHGYLKQGVFKSC